MWAINLANICRFCEIIYLQHICDDIINKLPPSASLFHGTAYRTPKGQAKVRRASAIPLPVKDEGVQTHDTEDE